MVCEVSCFLNAIFNAVSLNNFAISLLIFIHMQMSPIWFSGVVGSCQCFVFVFMVFLVLECSHYTCYCAVFLQCLVVLLLCFCVYWVRLR
jgi:hypothetical protein